MSAGWVSPLASLRGRGGGHRFYFVAGYFFLRLGEIARFVRKSFFSLDMGVFYLTMCVRLPPAGCAPCGCPDSNRPHPHPEEDRRGGGGNAASGIADGGRILWNLMPPASPAEFFEDPICFLLLCSFFSSTLNFFVFFASHNIKISVFFRAVVRLCLQLILMQSTGSSFFSFGFTRYDAINM